MRSGDSNVNRRKLAMAEARGDIQKCVEICRSAMTNEVNSDPRNLWYFGIKLTAFLLADDQPPREKDIDEAIRVLSRMLTVITRQDQPGYWARMHLQLGGAIDRQGDPSEAIMHYESSLEVFTKEKQPEEWALAKRAAGEAYYRLAIVELTKSLEYHREALTVFTPEKYSNEGLVETIAMIENVVAKTRAKKREKKKQQGERQTGGRKGVR